MKTEEILKLIEEKFGKGCAEICKERQRQIEVKGWNPNDDVQKYQDNNDLVYAATAYALPTTNRGVIITRDMFWPWKEYPFKTGDRLRELSKSGALIASQIDVNESKYNER